jgi:hypothetical protein
MIPSKAMTRWRQVCSQGTACFVVIVASDVWGLKIAACIVLSNDQEALACRGCHLG